MDAVRGAAVASVLFAAAIWSGCGGHLAPPPIDLESGSRARLELLSPPPGATVSAPFLVQAAIIDPGTAARPLGRVEVWLYAQGIERRLGQATPRWYDELTGRQFFDLQADGIADGAYELAVYAVPAGADSAIEPIRRNVTVAAGSGQLTTFVDAPAAGAIISLPFLIEGWAIDTRARRGTGVDLVEVWDGSRESGTMLGQATYGFYRPDLAGPAGETRLNSAGFSFRLEDLAAGEHDLHVYARSTVRRSFGAPAIIRVTVAARAVAPDNPDIETLLQGPLFPAALALTPDGRLFYGELWDGDIDVINVEGASGATPVTHINVATNGEAGLLSMALHPDFAENGYLYVLYSVANDDGDAVEHRVIRLRDGAADGEVETVVSGLPASSTGLHNGGAMAFGPDGMLYVSVGDNEQPERAADPSSLLGKILRYTPEGAVPADNPAPASPVYASGFRNVFGLAFQPFYERLWATENGPDTDDEVNIVLAGAAYGWPSVRGVAATAPFVDPVLELSPSVAPTGIAFTNLSTLYFCDVVTSSLHRVRLGGELLDSVAEHDLVGRGCGVGLVAAPDGTLFFSDNAAIYRYRAPAD